jgi:hypothetical protein
MLVYPLRGESLASTHIEDETKMTPMMPLNSPIAVAYSILVGEPGAVDKVSMMSLTMLLFRGIEQKDHSQARERSLPTLMISIT